MQWRIRIFLEYQQKTPTICCCHRLWHFATRAKPPSFMQQVASIYQPFLSQNPLYKFTVISDCKSPAGDGTVPWQGRQRRKQGYERWRHHHVVTLYTAKWSCPCASHESTHGCGGIAPVILKIGTRCTEWSGSRCDRPTPVECAHGIQWTESWAGQSVVEDTLKGRKNTCPYWESRHDSSVPIAQSLSDNKTVSSCATLHSRKKLS